MLEFSLSRGLNLCCSSISILCNFESPHTRISSHHQINSGLGFWERINKAVSCQIGMNWGLLGVTERYLCWVFDFVVEKLSLFLCVYE